MAWSWSHTQEAYENARANLFALDLATLREIHAEWFAYRPDAEDADSEGFSIAAHTSYHLDPPMPDADNEELAEIIWDHASEFATCDNGGFNAWMCPCGCHTVPFDAALTCPECGEPIWDVPHGSKLAKCWNSEGHASGGTLAFDTMPDE